MARSQPGNAGRSAELGLRISHRVELARYRAHHCTDLDSKRRTRRYVGTRDAQDRIVVFVAYALLLGFLYYGVSYNPQLPRGILHDLWFGGGKWIAYGLGVPVGFILGRYWTAVLAALAAVPLAFVIDALSDTPLWHDAYRPLENPYLPLHLMLYAAPLLLGAALHAAWASGRGEARHDAGAAPS